MFPKVKDNCPDHLKELVQPVSMLCASGVRISIKFDGATKSTFDEEIHKSSGTNGRLRIFGWRSNVPLAWADIKDQFVLQLDLNGDISGL